MFGIIIVKQIKEMSQAAPSICQFQKYPTLFCSKTCRCCQCSGLIGTACISIPKEATKRKEYFADVYIAHVHVHLLPKDSFVLAGTLRLIHKVQSVCTHIKSNTGIQTKTALPSRFVYAESALHCRR